MNWIERTQKKVQNMINEDKSFIKMCEEMDKIWRNEWVLPDDMDGDWFYKVVDTGPHNALNVATKVVSQETPRLKMTPLGIRPDDKKKANKIETALMWQLINANKRAKSQIVPDIVRSALRYDKVCIQIVHLPTHYKAQMNSIESIEDENVRTEKLSDLDAKRSAALRLGDFMINVRNPQYVYSRYDDMGLESVCLVQKMRGLDIYSTFGRDASFLMDGGDDWEELFYFLYDYTDNKKRLVWVAPEENADITSDQIIIHGNHEMPFIPWVIRVGGTSLDIDPEYQAKPFLESVYRSKSWEVVNTLKTLAVSDEIKYSGSPKAKTRSAGGRGVDVNYDGSQAMVELKPGEEYDPIAPLAMNSSLVEWYDRFKNELNAQTSVQVLADLNFPAGTAFATINAVLQTAIASLGPYKQLAEMSLADMFEKMLLWIHYSGRPIEAFGGPDSGYEGIYTIGKEDFNLKHIYLEVELNASAPTDRTERINNSVMLYRNFPLSAEEALEEIGITDPQRTMRNRAYEDMVSNELTLHIQRRQFEEQMDLQQKQMEYEQMQQGRINDAQQMQQMNPQQMMQEQYAIPEGPPAFDAVEGMGFDPNMGGQPPAEAAPSMTREGIMGETQGGDMLAEV